MSGLRISVFATFVLMIGFSSTAWACGRTDFDAAQDPTSAIHCVIERQLDAIKRDDAEQAFALAAPNIRRAFIDPRTFMALVDKDYKPMRRWEAVAFLDLRKFDDHCLQRVKLTDAKGIVTVASCVMVKANTGEWWVAGVAMEDKTKDAPKKFSKP